jgi:hypothetical protein
MMTIEKGQIFKETQSKLAEINDSMLNIFLILPTIGKPC